MTQARMTPERLREIEDMELPKGKAVIAIAELLDEVHALRAELAGAEERGAAREREACAKDLRDLAAMCSPGYDVLVSCAERIDRGDHVRTGVSQRAT